MSKPKGIRRSVVQLTVLCLSFLSAPLCAQENYADSIRRELPKVPQDTHRVFLLNELAWEMMREDAEAARRLLEESLTLARKLNYFKGQGDALNYRGVTENINNNPEAAVSYYEQSLQIRKQIGDKSGQASLYNNIGNVYEALEKYPEALRNYNLALQLRRETEETDKELRVLYNLSILYESLGNYPQALNAILDFLERKGEDAQDTETANAYNIYGNIMSELDRFEEALEYYQKAEKIHAVLGNELELAGAIQNVGYAYEAIANDMADADIPGDSLDQKEIKRLFELSFTHYRKSLAMSERLNDTEGKAEVLNNLGVGYKNLGSLFLKINDGKKAAENWETAMRYTRRSEAIRLRAEDKKGLLEVYNTIGDILRRQKKYTQALKYAKLGLQYAQEIRDEKSETNALKDLARAHFEMGNYKTAYDFRRRYDELRYARMNDARIKDNEERMAAYTDSKNQLELERNLQELALQEQQIALQNARLARENLLRNSAIGGAAALALLAFLLYNRNRIKSRANRNLTEKNAVIEAEKQRSDALLLNILPAETAAELKKYGKAAARSYESVTVMFTDFENFTHIAEQLSPAELVSELDTYFKTFDEIITRYGIEKIKTIGDAYMCAGGLPTPNATHATDMVRAAREIRDYMLRAAEERITAGRPAFRLRIGIHTGSVISGVVGNKKFVYDIWGDTVNIAARMESSGAVGKINLSHRTYELVKDEFDCTPRGKIAAKNKGEILMYFAE